MKKMVVALALVSVFVVATAMALNDNEQQTRATILSRLKVGQPVRLERAISGGYNINVFNDRWVKSFEKADPKFVPPRILEVASDFIVVDTGHGHEQAIAAHAIHVITTVDALKAPENDVKNP